MSTRRISDRKKERVKSRKKSNDGNKSTAWYDAQYKKQQARRKRKWKD